MGLYRLIIDLDDGVTKAGAQALAEEIRQECPEDVSDITVQEVN